MRLKIAAIGIVFTILVGVVIEHRAQAQSAVSIDLFYQKLSPYGEWSPHPEFGYIWQPYDVGPEWKPYADGRWEWSDQGWIWISYEPWGWATYHYGRWVYDDYTGWVWIPGTTWAPAWVSWHESPEYIGWSPLPPDRGFFIEIGFVFNSYKSYYKPYRHKHHYKKHRYYHDYYHNPHHYRPPAKHCVYLPYEKFGHHKHAGKASVPDEYAITLRNTKNITNIRHVNNKVINYGPSKYVVEKRSNRKLVSHKIVDKHATQLKGRKNINHIKDKSYNVYRPKIDRVSKDPYTTNRSSNIKNGSKYNGPNNHSPNVPNKKLNSSNAAQVYRDSGKKGFDPQKSGYNKYGYKNKQQTNYKNSTKLGSRKGKENINKNEPKNTYTTRHNNAQRPNNYNKLQYKQKDKPLKNSNYQSTKKSNKKSYSTTHNESFNNRSQIPQTNSYKARSRNIPTSQKNRFSKH